MKILALIGVTLVLASFLALSSGLPELESNCHSECWGGQKRPVCAISVGGHIRNFASHCALVHYNCKHRNIYKLLHFGKCDTDSIIAPYP